MPFWSWIEISTRVLCVCVWEWNFLFSFRVVRKSLWWQVFFSFIPVVLTSKLCKTHGMSFGFFEFLSSVLFDLKMSSKSIKKKLLAFNLMYFYFFYSFSPNNCKIVTKRTCVHLLFKSIRLGCIKVIFFFVYFYVSPYGYKLVTKLSSWALHTPTD